MNNYSLLSLFEFINNELNKILFGYYDKFIDDNTVHITDVIYNGYYYKISDNNIEFSNGCKDNSFINIRECPIEFLISLDKNNYNKFLSIINSNNIKYKDILFVINVMNKICFNIIKNSNN